MSDKTSKQEKFQEIFEKKSVTGAVIAMSLPTVLSQILSVIYNFADTWYLGRTGDENTVAAISVAMPIFVIMTAISSLFGIGATGVISRALGENKKDAAAKAFTFAVWASVAAGILYGLVVFLLREKIIDIAGGDEGTKKYVKEYLFTAVTLGGIPTMLSTVLAQLVRSSGKSVTAGVVLSAAAVLNIGLDPLFMFVLLPRGNEVRGAALATLLSSTVSCIIFIACIKKSKEKIFGFNIRKTGLNGETVRSVISTGVPSFLSSALAMVSSIFANRLMSSYGAAAIAGLGIAKKASTLAFNINMGFSQGVLPLVGYSYASKKAERMKKSVFVTLTMSLFFSLCCSFVFHRFASAIVGFFISEEKTVSSGAKFLSVLAFAIPFCAISFIIGMFFQATGRKGLAVVASVLRKGVLDIPLMYLLCLKYKEAGIVWATPAAEALSVIISLILLLFVLKKDKKRKRSA